MLSYDVFKWGTHEYQVLKYETKNNKRELQQAYRVVLSISDGIVCNCIAGKIHGHCKHMAWVRIIEGIIPNGLIELPPWVQYVENNEQYQKQEAIKLIAELKKRKQ